MASGDSLGRSPLQLAVQQMKRELFEHLLMIGARTDLQDIKVSSNPLDYYKCDTLVSQIFGFQIRSSNFSDPPCKAYSRICLVGRFPNRTILLFFSESV